MESVGQPLDRSGLALELDERFDAGVLREDRWVPHYLPEWTTPDRSAARYELRSGILRLRIDADQPAWRPEEGELRVSHIQSGTFSGPLGSARGQSRHDDGLTVSTPQPTRRLHTPTAGLCEVEMRMAPDPTCMLAFWLIGTEEASPEDSGELCVCEIFGDRVRAGGCAVNVGVKRMHDPRVAEDMRTIDLPIDPAEWHVYGVAWSREGACFHIDDVVLRTTAWGRDYPMQLMIDLFEFPLGPERDPAAYPKWAEVRAVRGYRPA